MWNWECRAVLWGSTMGQCSRTAMGQCYGAAVGQSYGADPFGFCPFLALSALPRPLSPLPPPTAARGLWVWGSPLYSPPWGRGCCCCSAQVWGRTRCFWGRGGSGGCGGRDPGGEGESEGLRGQMGENPKMPPIPNPRFPSDGGTPGPHCPTALQPHRDTGAAGDTSGWGAWGWGGAWGCEEKWGTV